MNSQNDVGCSMWEMGCCIQCFRVFLYALPAWSAHNTKSASTFCIRFQQEAYFFSWLFIPSSLIFAPAFCYTLIQKDWGNGPM